MLSLGIVSPVTRQTAGALFHQQLALQARGARRAALAQTHASLTSPGGAAPRAAG
jgi:hypothetical protein